MDPTKSNRRADGFTLVEMLVVIAIIGLLAALLLPVLAQAKARAKRIECVGDLREIGVAYHVFANDHGGKFPTQVSTNDSGSLEFVQAGYQIPGPFYFAYKYITPLAGTLTAPKLLACPADLERLPATNFIQFDNTNLSYDIGIVPDANDSRVILAADRGLPASPLVNSTEIFHVPRTGSTPFWRSSHGRYGNVLFADGHVDLSNDSTIPSEETIAEDLVYPDVKTSPASPGGGGGGSGGGGGGGGSGGGGSSGSGGGGGSSTAGGPSPSAPINQGGGTNSAAPTPPEMAQAGSAPSQPNQTSATQPGTMTSSSRQNMRITGGDQTQVEISNAVPDEVAVETNSPAHVAAATDDDTMMSPSNRKAAHVLRTVLAGSYFLILLLLLLYAAYRYWRWRQNVERKRLGRLPPESDP